MSRASADRDCAVEARGAHARHRARPGAAGGDGDRRQLAPVQHDQRIPQRAAVGAAALRDAPRAPLLAVAPAARPLRAARRVDDRLVLHGAARARG